MPVIITLIVTFFLGFGFRLRGTGEVTAWLLASTVMPAFVLLDEFVLPYRGGGASFWPIALVIGSFYGAMASGLGVIFASYIIKHKSRST